MDKKLSILITHYEENEKIYTPLFKSIALQQGVDFKDIEVVVVNDSKEKAIALKDIPPMPCDVRIFTQDHKGVSAARNYALDNAKGEYVMWIDCDDILYSLYGIYMVFSKIKTSFDMLVSTFVEEQKKEGEEYRLVRHDKDFTFIHGKVFRKGFLEENELRFKDELTIHEDGYFISLCATCCDAIVTLDNPFHLWKWNDSSVVRRDDENTFLMKTYCNLMDSRIAFCEEIFKRGYITEYFDAVCKTVIDAYYEFQKPQYLDEKNAKLVKKAKLSFKKFYDKFSKDYNECNINRVAEILTLCRNNAYARGFRVESQTISQFVTEIKGMKE